MKYLISFLCFVLWIAATLALIITVFGILIVMHDEWWLLPKQLFNVWTDRMDDIQERYFK